MVKPADHEAPPMLSVPLVRAAARQILGYPVNSGQAERLMELYGNVEFLKQLVGDSGHVLTFEEFLMKLRRFGALA